MRYQSAKAIREANLQDKQNILETIQSFYDAIQTFNPQINAYIQLFEKDARARAEKLAKHSLPESLPLYGVPVSIKESFVYRGSKTTTNFPPLKNYSPKDTSILAQRLEAAGAIILGKTNVPLLLSDCQTFGPLYPRANNPYDLSCTPGGSTGGGAAALAAGLSTIEIGSDIGGSIRNPASFCGLFGLKPTVNGHVHDGHIPPLPNRNNGFTALNSTGPLARSMADLQLAYSVCYAPLPQYQQYLKVETSTPQHEDLSGYRIAWHDDILGNSCSKSVSNGIQRVMSTLERKGAKVNRIRIDDSLAESIYSSWMTIFGFVVGQDFPWLVRQITKIKFNQDLRKSSVLSKHALANGLSMDFKKYSEALAKQKECIAEYYRLFDDYDFVLSPSAMGPAFKHNPKHINIECDGESYSYPDYCFLFVTLHNLTGLPVLTIPSGIDKQCGLPIGISIAAPHHSETQLMHFGSLLEREGFEFKPPAPIR